ncbi:uncharacterized protein EHS24_009040 [Apiotrichum porosum]|uniref:J domain-containing protein n=1 Tax=Apiotrichum porosum TaxID=105984 RepID=A0A427XNQ1_9TREE|nr:uncharacterized protein EHS24_009040 [Apiotrichum porosum]RSH80460.1 hypothetical protein EHS24_009040 [Apiotrichum porosum]
MPTQTLYSLLNVTSDARTVQIRRAYLLRLNEDPSQVDILSSAYDVLTNPAARARYDSQLVLALHAHRFQPLPQGTLAARRVRSVPELKCKGCGMRWAVKQWGYSRPPFASPSACPACGQSVV